MVQKFITAFREAILLCVLLRGYIYASLTKHNLHIFHPKSYKYTTCFVPKWAHH